MSLWESWGYWYLYFSQFIGAFFHHIPVPWYFITQKMHRFSHKYSITWEKAANCILWGEPGKLVTIFFPKHECFHNILYIPRHMGKMLVVPISDSKKICSKTHSMGRVWQIHTHTFRKVLMSLFRHILILIYNLYHMGNDGFSHDLLIPWKKTHSNSSYKKELRYPYTMNSYT